MVQTSGRAMQYNVNFDIEFKRNPFPGKFIVIEGIDGSGKTTQIPRIAKRLEEKGRIVFPTKDPSKGPIGTFIYDVLHGKIDLPPLSLQYLYTADRAATQEVIKKRLEKGEYVLSDRYFWSSVAYGTADMKKIDDYYLTAYSILSYYHQFLLPDLTIYLKVDPETGLERVRQTGKPKEHYKDKALLPKIERGYQYLLGKFGKEFTIIDGTKPVGEVTEEIISHIEKL